MEGVTAHFEPERTCAADARRFVVGELGDWGLDGFCDDAALLSGELVTNVILHCRTAFTVALRAIPGGLRIDVQDDRPDRLPTQLPVELDPLEPGTTGRGLRLVAGMSTRWGYFTTDRAKTVWAELTDDRPERAPEPLIELAARTSDPAARRVRLIDVPVRAAIASGFQIDDLVREVQLEPGRISPDDRAAFYELLERSAAPRLIGRQEAFRAAGLRLESYTLDLVLSPDELSATGELVPFLHRLAQRSNLHAGEVSPEVQAMRAWLPKELTAQFQGRPPAPFPGVTSP